MTFDSANPTRLTNQPTDKEMDETIQYVIGADARLDVTDLGKLRLPRGSAEALRCAEIKTILKEYSARLKVSAPLSVAIFGPPGSGKSHTAREIVEGSGAPLIVNLSQLSDPRQLTETFVQSKLGKEQRDPASVFFFDEFDAALGDVTLGWLRWFLTPMQDGEFFYDGQSIKVGKAIFIFAGGTAESLREFEKRALADPAEYRNKKVPDFISRLRGFIDIQGINNTGKERTVRRAVVLRYLLDKRWPGLRQERSGIFPIHQKTVRSLLSNVHFVHGARSMEALLDMCRIEKSGFEPNVILPEQELLKLHLSRGLLDGKTIGISASLKDPEAEKLFSDLTDSLLVNGATLAYGGDYLSGGTLHAVVEAAKRVPDELVRRTDKRIRNYLGFPIFYKRAIQQLRSAEAQYVEFLDLNTLSEAELEELNVPRDRWFSARPISPKSRPYDPMRHLAWALSLFRMRVRLAQDIHALIVLGGKADSNSWGRFSGVAEEVMLAILFRKPVYVLGGRGGAARAIGRLLGLDDTIAHPDCCLAHEKTIFEEHAHRFAIPGHADLPHSVEQVRRFFFNSSIGTAAWPVNGLDLEENRELFRSPISACQPNECVSLVLRGLLRLDWKLPPDTPYRASRRCHSSIRREGEQR